MHFCQTAFPKLRLDFAVFKLPTAYLHPVYHACQIVSHAKKQRV